MKKILSLVLLSALVFSLSACCIPLDKILPSQGKEQETLDTQPDNTEIAPPVDAPTEVAPPIPGEIPLVTTVIDYSREIVSQGGTTVLTHHTIKCPALSAETEDAKAINQEIYELCSDAVTTLENFEEEDYIYHVTYTPFIYNDVVALLIDMSVSNHYGSVFPAYRAYFYDFASGKKLTYAEYQGLLGFTEEDLRQVLSSDSWLSSIEYDILWAAVDADKTGVMAQSMEFMDEFCLFIKEDSVFD